MTRPSAGFSLVELSIVIAIIGLGAAVALPRFSQSTRNYQLSLAGQRIINDLAMAQARANSSSSPVTVSFNVVAGSYGIVGLADFDRLANAYSVRLGESPYNVRLTSASFGGVGQIVFDGYGTPLQGGTVVIALGSASRTITIEASSGRATTP